MHRFASTRTRLRPTALATRFFTTHKEIKFGTEGRAGLAKGIDVLARAVAVTLGPKGRNVLIEQSYGSPKITKDGVTVAKSIVLEDKFENLGARLVQDVASKTNDVAGDGTTTATVLARAIFSEGLRNIAAGISPMDLRKGVTLAVDDVVRFLQEKSRDLTSTDEISQVATISANGDKHVGEMIAQAMAKVGKEGVITIQEGKTMTDELEVTEGMRFDRGYISPYFVTEAKSQKCELERPLILLSEKKISMIQDLVPALEVAQQQRRPLVIIAEDVDGEALALLILNKLRGGLQCAAVKAPGFGDNRKSILHDVAVLTGGQVFGDELDVKLDKADASMLGTTATMVITKEDTIMLNGAGTKEAIQARCEIIRNQIAETTSEYEKEKLQERLAKISGGVAVIKVGGHSEVEVGEKKDRFVDALCATRAAVEEGIVPGGGVALLKASEHLKNLKAPSFEIGLGIDLVRKAITHPVKKIVENAGGDGAVVVSKILEKPDQFDYGFDAAKGEYTDMLKAGILDPTKVVRTALVDASGVASLLCTSECMITDAPKPDPVPAGAGGPPPGMGF